MHVFLKIIIIIKIWYENVCKYYVHVIKYKKYGNKEKYK